ncbi:hypothetical protein FDP41_009800 [Naegleria fowleri]|uniref:Enoyl-CoA hydratase n=1 Tax=Naegleria fowleri TaxID=5763 RepID=A0A6A5BDG7_NAEFO|nr:uncharacterized protein FDP41_009800 [Naegleria fowleri]KAF0972104.1 hypothetical protein FDP41_009800 [Naegleria fowleri]
MPSNASSAAQEPSPSSLYRNTPHPIMVATKSVSPVEQFLRSESGRITEFYTNMCFDLFVDSDTLGWLVLNQKYLKVMEGENEKTIKNESDIVQALSSGTKTETVSVNVIDGQFISDIKSMLEVIETLIKTKRIKTLLISSAKSVFCAGADINMMYPNLDEKLAEKAAKHGQDAMDRVASLTVPTISCIHGPALGGGFELCLATSYRLASEHKSTTIGLPEVMLGVIPGAGGTVRFGKLVGLQKSLEMILPGKTLSAVRAKKAGLVTTTIPYEDRFNGEFRFLAAARNYAGAKTVDKNPPIAKYEPQTLRDKLLEGNPIGRKFVAQMALKNLDKTTRGKYPAPYAALQSVFNATKPGMSNGRALLMERQLFGKMAVTAESKNLMAVFFMRENAKNWKRKFPKLGKLKSVRKVTYDPTMVKQPGSVAPSIAVIGAGVMGSGIAQLFAHKNYPTFMKDIKPEFVKNGMNIVERIFMDDYVKKNRMSREEALFRIKLVSGGVEYPTQASSGNGIQVVIEAAVENMALKKKILQECENTLASANGDVIFATNTSTLSINELASVSKRPDLVVGMHFFNPVHKMPLVEIIRGKKTSDETVATIYKLALDLGKIPIVCHDGPGFIVNRILGIYMTEAGRLINDGGEIQQIDKVMVEQFGMPMGPFRLLDEVGTDVAYHSGETLKVLGARFTETATGSSLFDLKKLVDAKLLGKKVGKGIFVYGEEAKKLKKGEINPELLQVFPGYDPKLRRKFAPEEIIDRCVLLMVNEACMILEEGVAETPQDIDVGMIFGTGFAPFRGGLLQYADSKGAKWIVKRLKDLDERYGANGTRFKPSPLLLRMAENGERFYPDRPVVTFVERNVPPRPKL